MSFILSLSQSQFVPPLTFNPMTFEFAYLLVPEINYVYHENSSDYEGELPQELKNILHHEEKRRA